MDSQIYIFLPIFKIGLLSELKITYFQVFLCCTFKKHKNIEAENFQSFPPQLLTFSQNIFVNFFT